MIEMAETVSPIEGRVSALSLVGADVRGASGTHDALTRAGLAGWNVEKVPLWADIREYHGGGGMSGLVVPGQYATVRTDPATGEIQSLAVVGERYQVYQNEDQAEFLDLLVDQVNGEYANAASLRGGRLVYLSIKLPEWGVKVGGVDPVDMFLNAVNSHDGSTQFMVSVDPVRAWCANQLNYFRKRSAKIRHTGSMKGKVQEVRDALKLSLGTAGKFAEEAEKMVQVSLTDDRFEAIVEGLFPPPRIKEEGDGEDGRTSRVRYDKMREAIGGLYRGGPSLANVRGTAWAGFNAVTEYLDWEKGVHGKDEKEREVNRAERILTNEALMALKGKARDAFMGVA